MSKKKEERSILAAKRLKTARMIYGKSTRNAILDWDRWQESPDIRTESTLKEWENEGIPLSQIEKVAKCFYVPFIFFTDSRISEEDFRMCIEMRKDNSNADISFATRRITSNNNESDQNNTLQYVEERPHEFINNFNSFITDRTQNFIGRLFVFEKIDEFLGNDEHDRGYFIIKGEPGIGKSAIIAKLVKDRGYVHHFNIAAQAINTVKHFITNICTQIINRYDLNHPVWPPDATKDGLFLNQVLEEAASTLSCGEKIIIAIDALDEVDITEIPSRANILFLPESPPQNVYFVMTTRHRYDMNLSIFYSAELHLVSYAENNRKDAGLYIKANLDSNEMQLRIKEWGVTQEEFIKIILDKSETNFMYLKHVLPAIQKGDFKKGTINELPQGLLEYYRRHWEQMQCKEKEKFEEIHQPVVCILATLKEAVTLRQIENLCKN